MGHSLSKRFRRWDCVMVRREMCCVWSSSSLMTEKISVSSPPTRSVKSSLASLLFLCTVLLLLAQVLLPRCHLFERLISTFWLLQRLCELAACCQGWQCERKTVRVGFTLRSLHPSSPLPMLSAVGRRQMLKLADKSHAVLNQEALTTARQPL